MESDTNQDFLPLHHGQDYRLSNDWSDEGNMR
jgi:hypothetical protein